MLEDVDANQGLMVTHKGYSQAAVNRAYYGPQNLELDILNFDKLLKGQGLDAAPYAGKNALLLSAPFGWIIDIKKHQGHLTCLYQRGLNLAEAQKKQEWIYVNFWKKDKFASNIEELVLMQNDQMRSDYTNLCVNEFRSPNRKDGLGTYIRIAQFDELSCREITGFIDCDEFIAFFVLFTTEELQGRNIRKLSHLLQYSSPTKISFENTKVIAQLEAYLPKIKDLHDRAAACKQLADWFSEMGNESDAMRYRRLCWDAYPEYYENITPLIWGELKSNNTESAISYSVDFFALGPENPRVMQDLLSIYEDEKYWRHFSELINRLKDQYSERNEALANINLHYAMHLASTQDQDDSIKHFKLAKSLFKKVDENHYVIPQIDDMLNEKA